MYLKNHKTYFEIAKERILISFKQNREYKANLYSIIFADIIFFIVYILFYQVFLGGVINEFLNWTTKDFILFYMFINSSTKFIYAFSLLGFSSKLLNGELNIYLTKPTNPFYLISFSNMTGATVITLPLSIIITLSLTLLFGYNFLASIFIILLGGFSYIIFINFFESLAFFIKQNQFIMKLFFHIIFINEKFTPKVFEGSFLKNFLYLLPSAFFGYFAIEIIKGNHNLFLFYLPWFLLINITLSILTYILWKYGLKKYEAFG